MVSPHQSVSKLRSLIFPLFFTTFPLSYLDETSYMDSVWDAIVAFAFFFSKFTLYSIYPFLKTISPIFFNTFPLSELDEASYIDRLFHLRICRLPSAEVVETLWKMWNVPNRVGKKSLIFIFWVIAKFHRKLGWWRNKNDHNWKSKNRKNLKFDFSFDSADCGSFLLIWSL